METDRQQARALDAYLAAAAKTGDRAALAALALRYERRLYRHAFRLVGETDLAADIAQDAWVDIVRGLARLDDPAAFAAFAFRITTRRVADAIRRKRRARVGLAAFALEPRATSHGADDAEMTAEAAALHHAMRVLSGEQRAALALFYQEDFSVAEIAVALAIPPGTVKTRLMAAREKLKAAIEEKEETLS